MIEQIDISGRKVWLTLRNASGRFHCYYSFEKPSDARPGKLLKNPAGQTFEFNSNSSAVSYARNYLLRNSVLLK